VNDLKEQAFYRFIAKTYWGHIALQFALLYAIGGWPWFVWLGCIRVCHHQQTMFSVGTCLPFSLSCCMPLAAGPGLCGWAASGYVTTSSSCFLFGCSD